MTDKAYCMSSYLMFRYIFDHSRSFYDNRSANIVDLSFERTGVNDAAELESALRSYVTEACKDGKAALALSGGIDSAILAKLMPKGSQAYTFRCVVPGKNVTDESSQAAEWAKKCGLKHEVIDITWEDVEWVTPTLMEHKGAPVHSIEAQIYLAGLRAKEAGFSKLIFGENADIIYGGMNGLLEKDWTYAEFVERYTYIMPYKVLKDPVMIMEPYLNFEQDGHIDGHDFINVYFRQEALGTYTNACETAGIQFVGPYSRTMLGVPLDYDRIRKGDTKYMIREVFRRLYPGENMPNKIPMPRPTTEWFFEWKGPVRDEFIPHCTDGMTGDQKWMVWALEQFLNILDGEHI